MKTEYDILLKDRNWLKKRERIIERDAKRCVNCGSERGLQVHHRQYHINKKISNFVLPWNYTDRYLITLCERCHNIGHLKYKVPVFEL